MSALDRLLVGAAVAVSPAAHRAARREQWAADVRDAHELDLSPTALAFGALTTALFHRRAGHRSTWGETMTAAPLHVRSAPHTIRTVPVLIVIAVCSFLVASALLGLLQRYNGVTPARPVFVLMPIGLAIVPGLAVASAVLLTAGASRRRRGIAALVVLAAATAWWSLLMGYLRPPLPESLTLGIVAGAWLGAWLVVGGRPRWTWSLVLFPLLASVLVFPLNNAVWEAPMAYSVKSFVSVAVGVVPFLAAIISAVVASRSSTDAPALVEQHTEALVDKSA